MGDEVRDSQTLLPKTFRDPLCSPGRFYKLHERKCEPIIMTVPRKVGGDGSRVGIGECGVAQ